jgi:hypothetical protein
MKRSLSAAGRWVNRSLTTEWTRTARATGYVLIAVGVAAPIETDLRSSLVALATGLFFASGVKRDGNGGSGTGH